MTSKKRRLELLPEILPKPERGSPEPGATSTVRARALARLSVLAALTAAPSACDGEGYGVVDPLPSPTGGSGGSDGSGGSGAAGSSGFGGTAYGVVDPLPPPPCDANAVPSASASYVPGPAGDAGAAPVGDAIAPAIDAGTDGGGVQESRQVRLELNGSGGDLFGSASPLGSNVSVLQQTHAGASSTIELLITGSSAALEITKICRFGEQSLRIQLELGESSVIATVQER